MLEKLDHPRRIDRFIDYFGEARPAGAASRERGDAGAAVRLEPLRATRARGARSRRRPR